MTSTNLADRYVGRTYTRRGGGKPGTWKITGATMMPRFGCFYYAVEMERLPGHERHTMALAQFRRWVRQAERLG